MSWNHFTEPLADDGFLTIGMRNEIIGAVAERVKALKNYNESGPNWGVAETDLNDALETDLAHAVLRVTHPTDFLRSAGTQVRGLGEILLTMSRFFIRDFETGYTIFDTYQSPSISGAPNRFIDALADKYEITPQRVEFVLRNTPGLSQVAAGFFPANTVLGVDTALFWNLLWSGVRLLSYPRFPVTDGFSFSKTSRDTEAQWANAAANFYDDQEQGSATGASAFFSMRGLAVFQEATSNFLGYRITGDRADNFTFRFSDDDTFDDAVARIWMINSRRLNTVEPDGIIELGETSEPFDTSNWDGSLASRFQDLITKKGIQSGKAEMDVYFDSTDINDFEPSTTPGPGGNFVDASIDAAVVSPNWQYPANVD